MLAKNTPDWNNYWENVNNNFKSLVEPRLNIESVYGKHTFEKLEKNSHGWKACCPFHEDKSPSFVIYSKNLHYHCFGCQEHGTPSKFLTKTKNLTRKEALIELAHNAGVDESYLFNKGNTQDKLFDLDSKNKLTTIRKNGLEQEIEIETKKWDAISKETSSLIHRIHMLETSANRIMEMERIRLNEINKIRELNSIIQTKLSEKSSLENEGSVTRTYKFNLNQNTTLKCKYELIFNDSNLEKINESTWIEKIIDDKAQNIINEEHCTYHRENGEFIKSTNDIKNKDEFYSERRIESSNNYSNLNLKINDIKEIGQNINNRNENLNKIFANELYDLIDNSLRIPINDLENTLNSIQTNHDFNSIIIKLPENKKLKITNMFDEKNLEKILFLIQDNEEQKLYHQKLEKSDDGLWIDKAADKTTSTPVSNYNEDQLKIISTLSITNKKFQSNLYSNSPEAHSAKNYLYKRGLSDEDIKQWELGFVSPNLISAQIKDNSFKQNELHSAGLLSDKGKEYFFGNRITFPIKSPEGIILGFSAREIINKNENIPKYINTPKTEIFSKGQILYGLDRAKNEIIEKNNVIVTEGFMDTIQMHKQGFKNTVAVMGTALTESHVNQIKSISDDVTLCFDNDKAGEKAFQRSCEIAGPFLRVKKLLLENAKDPDELLNTYGPEKMDEMIEKEKTISVPSQYVQNFEKNSTKINHSLYNSNLDMDI